jgi:5-methylcytosine-specific restriction protein A
MPVGIADNPQTIGQKLMPRAAMKPCGHPGCSALVTGGRCERHQAQLDNDLRERDKARGSSTDRGYTARWHRARGLYLASHPLCAECRRQGRLAGATVVHHIIPHQGNYKLFWAESNWESLCKPCHDRHTATHDGGFGNRATITK